MLTPELATKIAKMYRDSDSGQLDDLHKPFVEMFTNSVELQGLLGHIAGKIFVSSLKGDQFDLMANMLAMLEVGYKIRTTEELEEMAKL